MSRIEDADGNPTTVSAQYADRTSDSKSTVYFNFGGGLRLVLTRRSTNNSGTRYFDFGAEGTYYGAINFCDAYGDVAIDTAFTRKAFVAYYKSDTAIILWLGSHAVGSLNYAGGIFLIISDTENNKYSGSVNNANSFSSLTLVGSNNVSAVFTRILTYNAGVGKIDYVEKAFYFSGGAKAFETEDIYACSTVNQWSSISLPNRGNYLAIDTNALIPIDDEE